MLYKFKSKAGADVIMMADGGNELLRILGREPSAKGIIEPPDMPAAMAAITQAVEAQDAARLQAEAEAAAEGRTLAPLDGVSLRQRTWPLFELMRRAHAKSLDIVWGV